MYKRQVLGLAITLDDSLNALRLLWLIMLLFADLWHGFPDGVFSIRSLLINRWEMCIRDRNTFSLVLSSINYDYPSNVLFSWKLDGFYNEWSQPGTSNLIRYTSLALKCLHT